MALSPITSSKILSDKANSVEKVLLVQMEEPFMTIFGIIFVLATKTEIHNHFLKGTYTAICPPPTLQLILL